MSSPYAQHLDKCAANYQALTPLTFLERAAAVFPNQVAVIHGRRRFTYAEFYARARRLASMLAGRRIGPGGPGGTARFTIVGVTRDNKIATVRDQS